MESNLPPLRSYTQLAAGPTSKQEPPEPWARFLTGRSKNTQIRKTIHTHQTPKIISLQQFRGILPSIFSLFIKNTRSDMQPEKSFKPIISDEEDRSHLTEGQEQFLSVVRDPKNSRNLDEDTIGRFLQFFDPFLKRIIHPLPKPIICSSKKSTIPLTNFEYLRFIYSVFTVIIEAASPQILMQYFSKDRMNNIINLLQTPDVREKEMLENIITILIGKGFGISIPLTAIILKRLTEYANGSIDYLCVGSCLRILNCILKNDPTYDKRILTMRYQQDIIPLFLTDEIPNFIFLLIPIIQECYDFDSKNCIITLRYLIKHWPHTNHDKAVLYLHRIPFLIARIPMDDLKEFAPRLAELVYHAATSDFYSTVGEAINFLADRRSVEAIGPNLLRAHPDIEKRVQSLTDFWEFSVRKLAGESLPAISENLKAISVTKAKSKNTDAQKLWLQLSRRYKIPLAGGPCY